MPTSNNNVIPFNARRIPRPPKAVVPSPTSLPLRILIIDDTPEDRMAMRFALEADGFLLSEADNAEQGLAAAASLRPDCIILDCDLLDLDGLQVLAALRRPDGTMPYPVVTLTSSGDAANATELMQAGAFGTMSKDHLVQDNLGRVVQSAIQRFRLLEESRRIELHNAQLAAIVTGSTDAIISVGHDHSVLTWNPGATELFGYSQEEAVGRRIDDLIVPPDKAAEHSELFLTVARGQHSIQAESVRRHKDGRHIPVDINVSPMLDRAGDVVGVSAVIRDIREQKTSQQRFSAIQHALSSPLQGEPTDPLPETLAVDETYDASRLANVQKAELFDAPREASFDQITLLAGTILNAPVSLMTVVDAERQFFVSSFGLPEPIHSVREKPRATSYCRHVIESGKPVVIRDASRNPLVAEIGAWKEGFVSYLAVPLFDRDGVVIGSFCVADSKVRVWTRQEHHLLEGLAELLMRQVDNRAMLQELRVTEDALRTVNATFRHLVDQSPFGIFAVDADFRVLQVSAGAQKTFASVRPLIGRDFAEVIRLFWPEPFATEVIGRFRHTLDTGEIFIAPETVERRNNSGEIEAYDWRIERIMLPDGRLGVVCHYYDLSERQRHEEHVQLLMREVNHRAKNMLTLVTAIARRTAATKPEDFLQRFEQRMQGLAANQDLLVGSDWKAIPIGDLIRSQLAPFTDFSTDRISISGPPLELSATATQTIGMALHELATNAAKYGALSTGSGRVEICWSLGRDDVGEPQFTMRWIESGGPTILPPTLLGFGSTVIDDMVRLGLHSDVSIDYAPTGLVWKMSCPAGIVSESSLRKGHERVERDKASPSSRPRRVLVVEPEPSLALEIASLVLQAGFEVIGPVGSVAQALPLIEGSYCDAAILDITSGSESSEPIARRLVGRQIPFVTISEHSAEELPTILAKVPLIGKPVRPELLVAELKQCLLMA